MKKWIFLILMMCGISACQNKPIQTAAPILLTSTYQAMQAAEFPTAQVKASLSPTPSFTVPTVTPEPAVPTSIPAPALRTDGPYLIYFKQVGEKWSLMELDADGVGRKEITLPGETTEYDVSRARLSEDGNHLLFFASAPVENNKSDNAANPAYGWYLITLSTAEIHFLNDVSGYLNYFSPSFSPNGKWLVFYTPVLPPSNTTDISYPGSLTLNLAQLSDGKMVKKINLLPPDYPQNFDKLLKGLDSAVFMGVSPDNAKTSLQNSFLQGINSASWSPNGRYMAFASGMDGPSSDLYVYDLQTQDIQRLSSGLENIQWIDWSPDGKHIFHASSYYEACEGNCNSYYIATLDGKPPVQTMSDQTDNRIFSNWLTPSRKLLYTSDNGVGQAYLRYLDQYTNKTVDIFPYSFNSFALDPVSKMFIISSLDENVEGTPLGLHLVNPWDGSRKTVDAGVCNYLNNPHFGITANSLSVAKYRFVVKCSDGTVLVALDGSVAKLSEHALDVIETPKRGGLLAFDRQGQEAVLFSTNLDVIRRVKVHPPQLVGWSGDLAVWWRADGEGVFYLSDGQLYYWALDSDNEKLVDDAVIKVKQWTKN